MVATKNNTYDINGHITTAIRMKPISKGSIFVFNCIQQGLYNEFENQIRGIQKDLRKYDDDALVDRFISFGPFDKLIRVDRISDFSVVNKFSSLAGVSSQQIQCAYKIWEKVVKGRDFKKEPHFGIITQLKIQNHLILGNGPHAEEFIAELLINKLTGIGDHIEIELLATLGWDEFIIILKNFEGYRSLFEPIVSIIRQLKLSDLEELAKNLKGAEVNYDNIDPEKKHLFMATYSTPYYSQVIGDKLEDLFTQHLSGNKEKFVQYKSVNLQELKNKLNLRENFGDEEIHVSTRLSIKPGHLKQVNGIIQHVFDDYETEANRGGEHTIPEQLCSIGRYDVYPWLGRRMMCWQFVVCFELLRFSICLNTKRKCEFKKTVVKSQYYNSFTIVSHEKELETVSKSYIRNILKQEGTEGLFIGQMRDILLGDYGGKSIHQVCNNRPILRDNVSDSIVQGLSRIFSLFDSCIMDRFTCDSFLDIYPFMMRLREIINTIELDDKKSLSINIQKRTKTINLPEFTSKDETHTILIRLFDKAINHFYHGLRNRYLSSYPMMDKNETGVDFSGRLHRILSGVTGMQNLLLDDLGCHRGKGFNVISTYPHISIQKGSFNISKANVFQLLQVEAFCLIYHEIFHSFVYHEDMEGVINKLLELSRILPPEALITSLEKRKFLLEEMAGDIFLLNNAFAGDLSLFGYWYWMFHLKTKGKIDSNFLIIFILLSALEHPAMERIYNSYLNNSSEIETIIRKETIISLLLEMIANLKLPEAMVSMIENDINKFFNSQMGRRSIKPIIMNLDILYSGLDAIYDEVKTKLNSFCYSRVTATSPSDIYAPLYPMDIEDENNRRRRQWASIIVFRNIIRFIYQHRKFVDYARNGLLNFTADKKKLRLSLFQLRMALINTLAWEAVYWKKDLLNKEGIQFKISLKRTD